MKEFKRAVFCLTAFFIFCAIALAQMTTEFEVPAPPGGELIEAKPIIWGGRDINTYFYQSPQRRDQIQDYYENFFKGMEFKKFLERKGVGKEQSILRFRKEELVVNITLEPQAQGTEVMVAKYLQAEAGLEPEQLKPTTRDTLFAPPTQDCPGEDLAIVPRPPESIRWNINDNTGYKLFTYGTKLYMMQVKDFYKNNMPPEWALQRETDMGKVMEAYKKTTGKKNLGIGEVFSDASLEKVIASSYALDYTSQYGHARIVISPNLFAGNVGSLVQIIYDQKNK